MKRESLSILFFFLFIIYGCREGYGHSNEIDPKEFNEKIVFGIQTNAEWVKSPQSIAREFFPKDAHPEGNGLYSINENSLSETFRKVTVTEEGAFDDEVKGEKAVIDFNFKNGKWEIIKIRISLKRRY